MFPRIKLGKWKRGTPRTTPSFRNSTCFKVSLGFALIGVIPVLLLGIMSYYQTRREVYAKVYKYSTEVIHGVAENIDRDLATLENISVDIAYMEDVQNLCINYSDISLEELQKLKRTIRMDIAFKLSLSREVTDVYLYTPHGDRMVLYGDEGYKFALKEEYHQGLVDEIYKKNGHTVILSYSEEQQADGIRKQQDIRKGIENSVVVGRAIRSLNSDAVFGIIVMRVNERLFASRLQNVDLGKDAEMVIYNAGKRIISSTNKTKFPVGANMAGAADENGNGTDANTASFSQNGYIYMESMIDGMGWEIASLIPKSYLDEELSWVLTDLLLVLIPVLLAIAVGMWVFDRILAKPLHTLISAMKEAENGNLDIAIKNNSSDEIGVASRSFNEMIEKIKRLLFNIKTQEKEKRHAELAALQAQINPHFLSNTLNTASYMARMQKADNVENLLTQLVALLHISMDMRNDLITVSEEISYITSYVEIVRHSNYKPFDILFEIQHEVSDCLVPKLLLQPLVENALTHGIGSKHANGQIIVKALAVGDDIRITVTDNGQGIKPGEIDAILTENTKKNKLRFSGIGLANVNQRIKMLFGDSYGLQIESIYQMYTTVVLVIPCVKGEDCADEGYDCR